MFELILMMEGLMKLLLVLFVLLMLLKYLYDGGQLYMMYVRIVDRVIFIELMVLLIYNGVQEIFLEVIIVVRDGV